MNTKLLFSLASIVCLAATGFAADSVWVVGVDGSQGDLVTVELWLEYDNHFVGDSMSAFDIPLRFDAAVCTVEAYSLQGPFSVWDDNTKIDNDGSEDPVGVSKIFVSGSTFGPPKPFVQPGTYKAADIDFRLVGTPGMCTYIDTVQGSFFPPKYLGFTDKLAGGYVPGFAGDTVCSVRGISFEFDALLCDTTWDEGDPIAIGVTCTDNGGSAIDSIWLVDGDPADDYFTYNGDNTGTYYWDNPTPAGTYTVTLCALTEDEFEDCFDCTFRIVTPAAFILEFKKVLAWPGQQHVLVPVFLTAGGDPVGGWEILVDFDPTAVQVVDVVYGDFEIGWHENCRTGEEYASATSLFHNDFYPEWFDYTIGIHGHSNWVKVVGIMNMEWPQEHTPPIQPEQKPLFALVVDVNPLWEGMEAYFRFVFTGCGHNILSDSTGYVIWGPTDADRPAWLDYCPYIPDEAVVELWDGADGCPGIGILSVTVGDLNCNGMPYDVGDAIVFVNYLMQGSSALCLGDCAAIDNCAELQAKASDINGDGYYWTIADLVMLLNKINDNGGGLAAPPGESVELTITGSDVELASNVDVGAAYFVMKYEGDVAKPELNVDGMDLAWNAEDGLLKVLVYSMESNPIAAGTHTLFTVPGARNLKIDKAEIAGAGGSQLGVRISVAPKTFALYQNRPNPVRTATDIVYAIPSDSKVSLKIYDAAGMLVKTLVNEWKTRGFYSASWDANEVASGVYFYKLDAGRYSATRKLIRMR